MLGEGRDDDLSITAKLILTWLANNDRACSDMMKIVKALDLDEVEFAEAYIELTNLGLIEPIMQ